MSNIIHMGYIMLKQILSIMGFTRNTYFNWKKENRPIIHLLDDYFTADELNEYLIEGQIKKYEIIKNMKYEELAQLVHQSNKVDSIRLYEIIDFLKRNTLKYLCDSYSEILWKNGYKSGIYFSTANAIDKQQFLFQFQKLFKEANWDDVDAKVNAICVIDDYSKATDFKFEKEDVDIILEILYKFAMYNRLFNIEEL